MNRHNTANILCDLVSARIIAVAEQMYLISHHVALIDIHHDCTKTRTNTLHFDNTQASAIFPLRIFIIHGNKRTVFGMPRSLKKLHKSLVAATVIMGLPRFIKRRSGTASQISQLSSRG